MFSYSAIGSLIAPRLEDQLSLLTERKITALDFALPRGKSIAALTDEEAYVIRAACDAAGVQIATLLSSVGSHPLDTPIEYETQMLERVIQLAGILGTKNIRIYTFVTPEGEKPANFIVTGIQRLKPLITIAEAQGITLLLENFTTTVGEIPSNVHSLLHAYRDAPVRYMWNPANYVRAGVATQVQDFWLLLGRFVDVVVMRDSQLNSAEDASECVPGDGDGQLHELLSLLAEAKMNVRLSLAPLPLTARQQRGYSGADGLDFTQHRLNDLLRRIGIHL
jgi:sugar phosphate isomerase/epimerase